MSLHCWAKAGVADLVRAIRESGVQEPVARKLRASEVRSLA